MRFFLAALTIILGLAASPFGAVIFLLIDGYRERSREREALEIEQLEELWRR